MRTKPLEGRFPIRNVMIPRREFIRALVALGPLSASKHIAGAYGQDAGQQPPTIHNTGNRPQFHTEAVQVLIPFTAVDKHDHLVNGLSVDDLRVLADGKEQHINFLSVEDGPASILFVVDISGSMKKPVSDVQEAMRRMLHSADAADEFAVIEFSDQPRLTVDFTSMQSRVEERVNRISPAGHTSLTDGIILALREITRAHQPRKAVIIITDGQDNYSRYVEADAMRIAVETDVRVYGVEIYPPMGEAYAPTTFVERLARATGGRYLPTVNRKDIPGIIERIDIHRCYLLGFTPPADHRDGKSHRIDLKLKRKPVRGRVRLFWKERYRI